MSVHYLGVDPGLDGGLALLGPDGRLEGTWVMPTVKADKGRAVDVYGLETLLHSLTFRDYLSDGHAPVLEKAGPHRSDGRSSIFTNGRGYGRLEAVLFLSDFLARDVLEVYAKDWQDALLDPSTRGKDPKERAREYATARFPRETFVPSPRHRVPHQGIIDAVCLACYGLHMDTKK